MELVLLNQLVETMRGNDVAAPTDIENPLETLLKTEWHNLSAPMSPSRCIYRVPDRLRRVREKDYTPRVISIGPFYHGNEDLKPMEVHKRWYLKCFMERSHSKLDDYIKKIREKEEELKKCYAETIVLSTDDFVAMVLVDAIFLIEFLIRFWDKKLQDENDCIFRKPNMFPDIKTDLLMLENQLPLFILEDFFSLYNPESRGEAKRLSIEFLIDLDLMGFEDKLYKSHVFSYQEEGKHFVDLLRNLSGVSAMDFLCEGRTNWKCEIAPTIEKLHLAGVKIKQRGNLFDIRFKENRLMNGVLNIPRMKIEVSTELILRNLIAFEQCSICEDPIISHYIILMDMLVNSAKDVELLVENEIVENHLLGDEYELSSMINRLSRGIDYDRENFYYGTLCNNLVKFCRSNCHRWAANLRSKYFNTPWTTISVVAAIALLIFTAVQTFSAIYPLF